MSLEDKRSRQGGEGAKAEPGSHPDLKRLQQETSENLSQEINQLQAQKMRLVQEIADLQARLAQSATPQEPHALQPQTARRAHPIPLEVPAAPLPFRTRLTQMPVTQFGLLFVLVSTLALSIHNVIVRMIIGTPIDLFGILSFGGFIRPSLGNSLLILWMRMLVVVPMMAIVAGWIYPPVWADIKQLLLDRDRRPLSNVVCSGGFLFLSQVLIYIAIGSVGPGVAVTILFMYPLVTVPLAWWLFGDRPTRLRLGVMLTILLGVIFTAFPSLKQMGAVSSSGVMAAIFAGVAFAFYLIFMQLGFKKLHPVPVSLVQFITIFFLSSLILSLPLELGVWVLPEKRLGFLVGGSVLGALTLVGYLANNFGVRQMGAAKASIVASSGPVVTALLAVLILHFPLLGEQMIGIFLVTIGVTALSFERMRSIGRAKAAK
jgi:drug/metabolite transporter (DMT)-like permease